MPRRNRHADPVAPAERAPRNAHALDLRQGSRTSRISHPHKVASVRACRSGKHRDRELREQYGR